MVYFFTCKLLCEFDLSLLHLWHKNTSQRTQHLQHNKTDIKWGAVTEKVSDSVSVSGSQNSHFNSSHYKNLQCAQRNPVEAQSVLMEAHKPFNGLINHTVIRCEHEIVPTFPWDPQFPPVLWQ